MEYLVFSYGDRELLKVPYHQEPETEIAKAVDTIAGRYGVPSQHVAVFIEEAGGVGRRYLDC